MEVKANIIFEFECGSYFGGAAEYKICQVKERDRLLARGYNGLPLDVDFYIPQNEITELKNLVSLLNWEEEYKCEGKICDG